jgi:hypothetical protein
MLHQQAMSVYLVRILHTFIGYGNPMQTKGRAPRKNRTPRSNAQISHHMPGGNYPDGQEYILTPNLFSFILNSDPDREFH